VTTARGGSGPSGGRRWPTTDRSGGGDSQERRANLQITRQRALARRSWALERRDSGWQAQQASAVPMPPLTALARHRLLAIASPLPC